LGDDVPEEGWNGELRSQVVKITPNWVVMVTPMIFNDRICLATRSDWRTGYVAGFCYDKGGAAGLAALAWDPENEAYPLGFKKIACDAREEIGEGEGKSDDD
jgi:hypothetical protein